jgi:hypothetical protein
MPLLAATLAPQPPTAVPRVHVDRLDLPPGLVVARPESQTQLADAAGRADVVLLRHSAAVPSAAALQRVLALLEDALATANRPRRQVRLAVELSVVVVPDVTSVARKRHELAQLDALAGLSWSPSSTWVVSTAVALLDDVLAATRAFEIDDVLLQPLGPRAAAAVR